MLIGDDKYIRCWKAAQVVLGCVVSVRSVGICNTVDGINPAFPISRNIP